MKKWIVCASLVLSWAVATLALAEGPPDMPAERERLLRAMRPYSSRVQALAALEAAQALEADETLAAPSAPAPARTPAPQASDAPAGTAMPLDPAAWEAFARTLATSEVKTAAPAASPTPASPLGPWYEQVVALDEALYQAELEADALPGTQTHALLEVLERYNVRATFFLVGDRVRGRAQLLRDIVAEGHAVGNHSHTHDREQLSLSVQSFEHELLRMARSAREVLGYDIPIRLLRVPYGHNTVGDRALRRANEMGYLWVDWNATNDDATGETITDHRMVSAAVAPIGKFDQVVLLIHENKKQTVRTLPEIIERYLAAGYAFRPLTANVKPMAGVPMSTPKP
ncbi:MAG TPA: polysaccharide deacetylase family protein [Clostridia bacterium]|nr:polysaccharide deacetylase family protein [Clostridia bacterium]